MAVNSLSRANDARRSLVALLGLMLLPTFALIRDLGSGTGILISVHSVGIFEKRIGPEPVMCRNRPLASFNSPLLTLHHPSSILFWQQTNLSGSLEVLMHGGALVFFKKKMTEVT